MHRRVRAEFGALDTGQAKAVLDVLPERQRDVLKLVIRGVSRMAIAERLGLSERTVADYNRRILRTIDLMRIPTQDATTGARLALLTVREREVLTELVKGGGSKEVGIALNLSSRTVDFYREAIIRKLAVSSLIELGYVVGLWEGRTRRERGGRS